MKVLQINSVCGIGSTGRIATDIHNILIEKGRESYIAYGRDQAKNCDNTIKIGTNIDLYTHIIKTRVFDKHGFGSKKATKDFIDKVKEINPDIIHLHNLHGYYINIEILFEYLKEINKPVVWTLHDCWPFTGHGAYLDNSKNYNSEDIFIYGTDKNSYPSSLLFNNAENNYSRKKEIFSNLKNLTIVTPSKWLADLVQDSFLSEYPVKVINNGIDLKVFKPIESNFRGKYNLQDKFIILGVASNWDGRKGLKYFVEMSKMLEKDERIVLVGLSEKQLQEIPDDIIGISKTNNIKELADIYSSGDVFVNPTLQDNFPTTNLEALACGTPVITFNTGGSVESVSNNTGSVVYQQNSEILYEEIQSYKFKEKPIFDCRDRAESLYNKHDRYNEYIETYREVAKKI